MLRKSQATKGSGVRGKSIPNTPKFSQKNHLKTSVQSKNVKLYRSMFANRISFTFDLKGPSVAMDTACSASLVALDQGFKALRAGEISAALIGGVNLCLDPIKSLENQRFSMLSPQGQCRSFDRAGNGYVRSEAAVVIYLERKSSALRTYATIIHIKTANDGYKEEGVTFPSGREKQILMEETYKEAGLDPAQVNFIEAHGTGTKVGDPAELNAIAQVFCKGREIGRPLLVGSVKSNCGHSEPASGRFSVLNMIDLLMTF
jgi:fatty acid synthase, animal type